MNPWELSSSELLIWGVVLHLVADWVLQNDWMAQNKANLRHPAGYVHAGIHGVLLAFIFGWVAIPLAIVHLLIDTRVPVVWWSQQIKQTQPHDPVWASASSLSHARTLNWYGNGAPLMDVGMEVRFWTDQVFHIICIAIAALVVTI